MKITASVVLYNTPYAQFKELLFSVIHSETVTKFYVIDNSPKKNPELYEKWDIVEYIPHENTGYGSSHNIAMRKAIEELPEGAFESIKGVAASMIHSGQYDSVKKIKVLDEIFDTKLLLTLAQE